MKLSPMSRNQIQLLIYLIKFCKYFGKISVKFCCAHKFATNTIKYNKIDMHT